MLRVFINCFIYHPTKKSCDVEYFYYPHFVNGKTDEEKVGSLLKVKQKIVELSSGAGSLILAA